MKSIADSTDPPDSRLVRRSNEKDELQDMLHTPDEFAQYIVENKIDFLDFGCSSGNSLKWGKSVLGGEEGLGIDNSPKKVAQAREAGLRAMVFDINRIPDLKLVRFTILSHFLEHVSDLKAVRHFIQKACQVSTHFVLIKQPYFDADGYLLKHGLKTFWSDWRGHPNMMSTMSLFQILRDLRASGHVEKYSIHAKGRILSSADPRIHTLESPIDQHEYDPTRHPAKPPEIVFEVPVFYETVAFVTMKGMTHRDIVRKYRVDMTLVDELRT
jgi:SAM-dependent methyltransferase